MLGDETKGASGGSSGALSSAGSTSVPLDVGCMEPVNPKGEATHLR